MQRQLTAIIEREGDGYVSLCPEFDIASQGSTIEEARENLREALELFFETASPDEVRTRLRGEVYVTQVEVAVGKASCPFWKASLRDFGTEWISGSATARKPYSHAEATSRYEHNGASPRSRRITYR